MSKKETPEYLKRIRSVNASMRKKIEEIETMQNPDSDRVREWPAERRLTLIYRMTLVQMRQCQDASKVLEIAEKIAWLCIWTDDLIIKNEHEFTEYLQDE